MLTLTLSGLGNLNIKQYPLVSNLIIMKNQAADLEIVFLKKSIFNPFRLPSPYRQRES